MSDLTKKTENDLEKELKDKKKKAQSFRFGSAGSKTRNTKEGKNLRKDIARIMTELSSRRNNTDQ